MMCERSAARELSHVELLAEIRGGIASLLSDPLLSDVSPCSRPEEIDASLALLRGRALVLELRFHRDRTLREAPQNGLSVVSTRI